jgi:hypothetical protein
MFEVIKDYCAFHKCSLIINYKSSANTWSVALLSGDKFTGHHHAEDLATAFNSAKEEYENGEV